MTAKLEGRVALVTGSSKGIGRAIAEELAACGANVVINYLEGREPALELADQLQTLGQDVMVVQADVSQRQQVEKLVAKALERFERIDILVNNAGITRDRTLRKMSFEEWDRVMEVNLDGVFNCTKAVTPQMVRQRRGSIVNISSVIGQIGAFGQTNYSAAKAGVIGFTKSCALELAQFNINVNAVCPGFVETDMFLAVKADIRETIRRRIPLERFARPAEIAQCIRFLVTEGEYITGQCLNVNGGLFM